MIEQNPNKNDNTSERKRQDCRFWFIILIFNSQYFSTISSLDEKKFGGVENNIQQNSTKN